ncbi:biotin operon repressor [Hartmannibacter diazotrophicus]|uniref:Biotin operon repressor n=1 Tax=Hartmannibacter diazotrophicus TaxID=1482074 RepID=A0A2C9D9L5_9HYPH|nr:YafY family protein [Hartmannibacter diazotrophicus]SON57002.1 biotin operon repressor [Hartmannibacter diazotrophicus]
MSRAERLLDLIQILRAHRRPVSGKTLADELGISLRTLYRDIDSLRAQGAGIEGEAGLGYVLKPGFMLPPMMFSEDEIEALVLGSRWVAKRSADDRLSGAARTALARIGAVLPADLRSELENSALMVGSAAEPRPAAFDMAELRKAIRTEHPVEIDYLDAGGTSSRRTLWPFAIGYFDHVQLVAAWCELRTDYRNFRTDRITALSVLERRYPRRRAALLKEWRKKEGVDPPEF